MRSILVATDFSQHARNAALRAGMLASTLGLRSCELLHVASGAVLARRLELKAMRALQERLAALAEELAAACHVRFVPRVEEGLVVELLSRAAGNTTLTVMGAQGTHPFRNFVIGTTAERVLRKARMPVLVVKRKPLQAYRRVLVPVDFSRPSRNALDVAATLAPEADVEVLHAFDVPMEGKLRYAGVAEDAVQEYRRQARAQARTDMERLLADLGDARARAFSSIVRGYAPRAIIEAQEEFHPDLIAVGKQGNSRVEHLILGGVTLHVLADARCDVLVVPGK